MQASDLLIKVFFKVRVLNFSLKWGVGMCQVGLAVFRAGILYVESGDRVLYW